MNADSRSSGIFIVKKKSTKKNKLRNQHLNSLKELVLSMHFLKANDVVTVKELLEVNKFRFPAPLSGKDRSDKALSIPSNTSQTFRMKGTTIIPPFGAS